jgi:hypothetical protein
VTKGRPTRQLTPPNVDVTWSTRYKYMWLPYACKRPCVFLRVQACLDFSTSALSQRSWMELVRPKSLLAIGDSVMRDVSPQASISLTRNNAARTFAFTCGAS